MDPSILTPASAMCALYISTATVNSARKFTFIAQRADAKGIQWSVGRECSLFSRGPAARAVPVVESFLRLVPSWALRDSSVTGQKGTDQPELLEFTAGFHSWIWPRGGYVIGSSFSNAELRASAFCGQRNRNSTEEIRDGPHLSTSVRLNRGLSPFSRNVVVSFLLVCVMDTAEPSPFSTVTSVQ